MLRTLRRLLSPDRLVADEAAPGPDALVQVYLRADGIYIEPSDRTRQSEAGYWVSTGEIAVLPPATPDMELGAACLHALARSRLEVVLPPRDAKLEAGLFRAMRVRSRRAAMTGTRSCLLSREPARAAAGDSPATAARLRIEALHNGGTSGDGRGYSGLREPAVIELPTDSDAIAVGEAIRWALQRATVAA